MPRGLSLRGIALNASSIPTHATTTEWVEHGVNGDPGKQGAKVETCAWVKIEQRRACALHDYVKSVIVRFVDMNIDLTVVHWPSVTPSIEARRKLERIEFRGHNDDHLEDLL